MSAILIVLVFVAAWLASGVLMDRIQLRRARPNHARRRAVREYRRERERRAARSAQTSPRGEIVRPALRDGR